MKMELTVSSETSAIRTQTPGNYPKRNKLHLEHGENLKTRIILDIDQSALIFYTQVSGKWVISNHQAQRDVKFYSVLPAGSRLSHFTHVHIIYVCSAFTFYSDVQISRQIRKFPSL